jgi:hypothetical protein
VPPVLCVSEPAVFKYHGVISGSSRDVRETCVLLECYAALGGSTVPTFRDNPLVPSSRVKKSKKVVPKRRYITTIRRCVISQKRASLEYHYLLLNMEKKTFG